MFDDAEIGSTANSYEILAKLATGGMAELFLARGVGAVGVKRYVVLKRVLQEYAENTNFIGMFLDEARLVAQLQHPNIAQVHDVGKLGNSYFFTMEYVHGETVRALLQHTRAKRKDLSVATVLAIVGGAAAGLHHAHERKGLDGKPLGIVHRDVTPSNLMVSFEGNVKVVDFGVAKAKGSLHDTKAGVVKGKTTYLSPEQCRSEEIDRRSDLFTLGIVMWEMLTCERLFRRNTEYDTMDAIVNEDAPAPSTIRADLPKELDAIVGKLLARDRNARYATAQDLVEAIEDAAMASRLRTSASMLAKVLKETFGERPEPWTFLEQQAGDGVTVTVAADVDPVAPAAAAAPVVPATVPGGRKKVKITANPETQLKKLPGLELVSEALSAIAAGTTSHDDSDADLAIPRAPVLPMKSGAVASDEDSSDGVMHVLEDQPTSRWSVIVPPELDLDDAEAAAHAAGNPISVTTPRPQGAIPPPPANLATSSGAMTPITAEVFDSFAPPPSVLVEPQAPRAIEDLFDGAPAASSSVNAPVANALVDGSVRPPLPLPPGPNGYPTRPMTPPPMPPMQSRPMASPTLDEAPTMIGAPMDFPIDEDIAPPASGMTAAKKTKILIAAALAGAVILAIIAIAIGTSGGGDKKAVAPPAALDDAPKAALATATPDAAALEKPPVATPVDAAPAIVTPPPPPPPIKKHPPPANPPPTNPPPPTGPKSKFNRADLQKSYEAGQYIGVMNQCSAGAVAVDPAMCTLAACRLSNVGKAKQFYAATPAKRRAQVIQTCASLGIALAGTTIQKTDP